MKHENGGTLTSPADTYAEDKGLKRVTVEAHCSICKHSEKDPRKVAGFLAARGFTQCLDEMSRPKPGENTLAKDYGWRLLPTFADLLICRRDDCMVGPGSCCTAWTEDTGHIISVGGLGVIKAP